MDKDQPTSAFAADIPSPAEMDKRQRILLAIQEEIARGADFDTKDVPDESQSLLEPQELHSFLIGLGEMREGKVMTTEKPRARIAASIKSLCR